MKGTHADIAKARPQTKEHHQDVSHGHPQHDLVTVPPWNGGNPLATPTASQNKGLGRKKAYQEYIILRTFNSNL